MLTVLNYDDILNVDDLIFSAIEADQLDVEMDELQAQKERNAKVYSASPHHCFQLLFLS